jgi:hypothetical protein
MRAIPLSSIMVAVQVAGRRWKSIIKKAYNLAKTKKFYLSKNDACKKLAR